MAVSKIQIQDTLQKPYDRTLFAREVLSPVFGSGFNLSSAPIPAVITPNKSESAVIDKVWIYGNIRLDDITEITCYEVLLQPTVRIEQSKVAIQQYVRKLLTAGQAALINFVAPTNKKVWRLTLVAKDSVLTEKGVKEKTTNAKRYTFLLGPAESCKTAAERFETLSAEKEISFQSLINAFSVEKLSKAFFDEYTLHYQNFCNYLQESNYRKSVFNIDFHADATKEEKDKAGKPIRDFVKKLLGRIVFLYFVQKKAWLGASNTNYTDGLSDFIKQLFLQSGANDAFYSNWLTPLFFDTLNKERLNDDFEMPDGAVVKVPFLNGGLFDKEDFDEHLLTFKSNLFHHPNYEDVILTSKNNRLARGFLDFLDAFNFTVYEDSPEDHIVAVDPEMLGHIFENLLEDNKDKGAFYTPKEIVHYMCQESLTEYLCTTLQIKDEVAEREAVNQLLKNKVIDDVLKPEITELEKALDKVKICDPAIGSGAFPMGLLQEIFSIKELIAYETNKEWKPAETKLNIIQNSIYGVDIEKGAVDIARLRFWLSLVVDEEKPKALPNLDYKIVVGNSLVSKFDDTVIEIDWSNDTAKEGLFGQEIAENKKKLLQEISDKQTQYFTADNKQKEQLNIEIRELKLEILSKQLELMIENQGFKGESMKGLNKRQIEAWQQTQDWEKALCDIKTFKDNPNKTFKHFDWKLDFPEVLNPLVFNKNEEVENLNLQIDALNKQIEVINHHLQKENKILRVLHFQVNSAQNQVDVIKLQIEKIEEEIKTIFGDITKVKNGIVSESDDSLTYKVSSINKGIEQINESLKRINQNISKINPNIGFDIVIANPPYIKEYTNRDAFEGFRHSLYYQGKMDIWYGFACKMLDLLKPKGIECFIAQNNWITSAGASIFRDKVLSESEIRVFTDFGNYKVFETAGIQTMIYVLQKLRPNNEYELKYSVLHNDKISKAELIKFLVFSESDSNSEKFLCRFSPSSNKGKPFTFNNNTASDILNKLKLKGNIYLTKKEVAQGIVFPQDFVNKKSKKKLKNTVDVGDGIFVLNRSELKGLRLENSEMKLVMPYYTTEELGRYYAIPKNKFWIIYTRSEFKNAKAIHPYPNIKKHLDRFKNVITSDNKPYGLHRAREERFFIGESIVAQRKCPNRPSFTYTDFNCYVSATFYIIQTGRLNMKYLTGLLNSKLIAYWLRNKGKMQGNNYQIDKEPLLAIPLIKPTDKFSKSIEKIVIKILSLKSEGKDTTALEQEIDNLVYKLYELTYDEVKVIDPDFSLTEKEYEAIKLE